MAGVVNHLLSLNFSHHGRTNQKERPGKGKSEPSYNGDQRAVIRICARRTPKTLEAFSGIGDG